ncbi:acid-sensing ion channel 1 [Helicoverpa zea]|uniref:acid-sensing ion channel 1 n=1 Tax=Helicoverpa zea TaxID=7113 RepID=UPI001F57084D|nr:acid-sensing ion channel 1 [Helicoverpa zea]
MTVEEKIDDPKWKIREQCAKCVRGPNLIKTVVVVVCIGVVLQQITSCIHKLIDIPITTYTHFDFNKTLTYPSVTFCREPPYKFDKMLEYGLYAHPRYTSTWRNFDFENIDLDEMWDNITFNEKDMFVQYGLNGYRDNVELTPTIGFTQGRCYTMNPKILSTQATKALGYSVTLQHTAQDITTTTSIQPPGYHVYIHYVREPFTEVTVYNGGMVDSLYVNVGETLSVKLKVDQYKMISSADDPCFTMTNYSANECTTKFVWDQVIKEVGCSGPWMKSFVPRCNNYTQMTRLIAGYLNTYESHNCSSCPRICNSFLYNGFVTDRQKFYFWDSASKTWSVNDGAPELQTNLFIYFNSMMVSVYEERYNYDWNLFVSDLGGSIGFLLGLSVIGLMQIFGKAWRNFIQPFISCKKKGSLDSISSNTTADVKTIRQEYIEKWNEKNLAIQKI